jgi:hypothetical protein
MKRASSRTASAGSDRRSRPPLWMVEGLDIVETRRRLTITVMVLVAVVGVAAALLFPQVVPPNPLVGAAVGLAAVLLGVAAAVGADATDLRVRGPRHVGAAGGELVAVLPVTVDRSAADELAAAVLDAREEGRPLLLGLAASGLDVAATVAWTDALALAVARTGVTVLRVDLASGRTEAPGLAEVEAGDRKLTEVVEFEPGLRLARTGVGDDQRGALRALTALPPKLPRDLDVLLVALPMAASRGVVQAARVLDHVLIVAERARTSRVDLIAGLDALDAADLQAQVVLLDDRTASRLAIPEPDEQADVTEAGPELAEHGNASGTGPAGSTSSAAPPSAVEPHDTTAGMDPPASPDAAPADAGASPPDDADAEGAGEPADPGGDVEGLEHVDRVAGAEAAHVEPDVGQEQPEATSEHRETDGEDLHRSDAVPPVVVHLETDVHEVGPAGAAPAGAGLADTEAAGAESSDVAPGGAEPTATAADAEPAAVSGSAEAPAASSARPPGDARPLAARDVDVVLGAAAAAAADLAADGYLHPAPAAHDVGGADSTAAEGARPPARAEGSEDHVEPRVDEPSAGDSTHVGGEAGVGHPPAVEGPRAAVSGPSVDDPSDDDGDATDRLPRVGRREPSNDDDGEDDLLRTTAQLAILLDDLETRDTP